MQKKSCIKIAMIALTTTALSVAATDASADNKHLNQSGYDGHHYNKENLRDDTHVTLSGTVGRVTDGDEFELRYSNGSIMVDTNDNWPGLFEKNAGHYLRAGDRVTVTGEVDDNFFTHKEIDALRLTRKDQTSSRTYHVDGYSFSYDNEHRMDDKEYEEGEDIVLSGKVKKIIDDQKFILSYNNGQIQVDADDIDTMKTNRLRVGDQVTVYGEIDDDWFEKREVDADRLVLTYQYPPMASK